MNMLLLSMTITSSSITISLLDRPQSPCLAVRVIYFPYYFHLQAVLISFPLCQQPLDNAVNVSVKGWCTCRKQTTRDCHHGEIDLHYAARAKRGAIKIQARQAVTICRKKTRALAPLKYVNVFKAQKVLVCFLDFSKELLFIFD